MPPLHLVNLTPSGVIINPQSIIPSKTPKAAQAQKLALTLLTTKAIQKQKQKAKLRKKRNDLFQSTVFYFYISIQCYFPQIH
jgi:hypothetical protein